MQDSMEIMAVHFGHSDAARVVIADQVGGNFFIAAIWRCMRRVRALDCMESIRHLTIFDHRRRAMR